MVAKELAKRLGEDTQLLPITATLAAGDFSSAAAADRIGFVFPVYAFGPPRVVLEFVKKLPANQEAYVFSINTNGGMPGRPNRVLRWRCKKAGMKLAAGWSIQMPGNAIFLHEGPDDRQQESLYVRLPMRLDAIAAAIRSWQEGPFEDTAAPMRWALGMIWQIGSRTFAKGDKKFFATDACTHCGLCRKICPVKNIQLEQGRPVWLHHCTACMACIQYCPVEAIQYGKKTIGRRRFRNPHVMADELCAQNGQG